MSRALPQIEGSFRTYLLISHSLAAFHLKKEFPFEMSLKNLAEHGIHCLPCSDTKDVIVILP